jgi:3-oxoacyl-[acyl-carrier protein] reductase
VKRFEGKTALITGSAMGLGRATAEKLAGEGARVLIVDIDEERGPETLAALPGAGHVYIKSDLSRRQAAEEIAAKVGEVSDGLDVLVNNAGIYLKSSVEELSDTDYERQLAINLHLPLWLTKALIPLLRDRDAAVVNVSSECGWRPRPLGTAYDVSKAALGGLTRSLAAELWHHRIRVNEVAPGGIVTEMHFLESDDPAAVKRELEDYERPGDGSVMGRMGRPAEIAAAIAFLASDEASFITAGTVHVDGGQGVG